MVDEPAADRHNVFGESSMKWWTTGVGDHAVLFLSL